MRIQNIRFFTFVIALIMVGGLVGTYTAHSLLAQKSTITQVDSIVVARNIPYYTKDASMIVIGTVQNVGDQYWSNDHSMVEHDIQLSVEKVLKGDNATKQLPMTVYGGSMGKIAITQEDAPQLISGQKVLLFLGTDYEGKLVVYAGQNGVYKFINDSQVQDSDGKVTQIDDLENQITVAQATK